MNDELWLIEVAEEKHSSRNETSHHHVRATESEVEALAEELGRGELFVAFRTITIQTPDEVRAWETEFDSGIEHEEPEHPLGGLGPAVDLVRERWGLSWDPLTSDVALWKDPQKEVEVLIEFRDLAAAMMSEGAIGDDNGVEIIRRLHDQIAARGLTAPA